MDAPSEAVTAGHAFLARAEWAAARASFTAALKAEESAEALEGLSWAAWWLDDADTVFDARERAHRLYRARSDDASAARMAIWLAADNVDFRGLTAVAGGWLRRARRLLTPLAVQAEHGWLAFHEGYLASVRGDMDVAMKCADAAADIGRRLADPDLEMLGLALAGSVLVSRAQVAEGMLQLDEATAMASAAQNPISGGWACCFLISACTAVLDFDRAAQWCDHTARFARQYGSRYIRAICRAEYGAVYLWRGQWRRAEDTLTSSIDDFARSRPAMVGGPLTALAELRRRQGRDDEATELLDAAGTSGPALLCRARIEFGHASFRRSAELAERALRHAPPGPDLSRLPALEQLIHAKTAFGDLVPAAEALESLREIVSLIGTDPLRAIADRCEAMVAAATGDHERARPLYEDAMDRFTRCNVPFEAASTRVELATTLFALDRPELAAREARIAATAFLELGAESEAQSARRLLNAASGDRTALTDRERDVIGLVADGLTNRQIAERLVVSEHTVHRHVTNVLRKLDLPSRTAAAAYALRSGWIVARSGESAGK